MEGRRLPQGNELTCLGPFHRKLQGLKSQVAELGVPELEEKELGSDCFGSDPSSVTLLGLGFLICRTGMVIVQEGSWRGP